METEPILNVNHDINRNKEITLIAWENVRSCHQKFFGH